MNGSLVLRRSLKWTMVALATLIVLVVLMIAALQAGFGRRLLLGAFAWRTGRDIQVRGRIEAHLFSWHPRVTAEHVTIGNPPWMPSGLTAEVDTLAMVLKLPTFTHRGGVEQLDMAGATLFLLRDGKGRANWQMIDPARKHFHRDSLILRRFSVDNAHVVLADALHHLQFVGTVTAVGPGDAQAGQPVRIEGKGQLNGRAATFEVRADPLATASHRRPYQFSFTEHSSGSQIQGQGNLPVPFDFQIMDAGFQAEGPDLKDLYFLTGVHLLDTGPYHLTGRLARRGLHTDFNDLSITSGSSDMHGTVAVDRSTDPKKLDLVLSSRILKLSDFGRKAAGRSAASESTLLFPDTMLSLNALRTADSTTRFHADELDVGRVAMHDVSAQAVIDGAVLTIFPLSAQLLGGRTTARVTLDGRKDVPTAAIDLRITDLQLAQLPYKDAEHPPLEGPLRARLVIRGTGRSPHQIAAHADGTLTAQLAGGSVRESFAELTGLDLRGLGLLLVKNRNEIPVRCAGTRLKAQDGTLRVQNFVADTAPILITGSGQINLDSESLDLGIQGDPKEVRLFRLRAPVSIQGTLRHPQFHVQTQQSKFLVVDTGKAQDADCPALLAEDTP